jgi:PIN domain nuclease of toxin-antitoxin system
MRKTKHIQLTCQWEELMSLPLSLATDVENASTKNKSLSSKTIESEKFSLESIVKEIIPLIKEQNQQANIVRKEHEPYLR